MPRRPCIQCGAVTPKTRCPSCEQQHQRGRNARRTHYQGGWTKQSRDTRAAWVEANGWVCPGVGRPPHPVQPGTLTLDHSTGRVCCLPCNVAAGPAGPDATIPHT